MRKVISINSPRTIDDAIKQLEKLKTQRIPNLCREFCEKLADKGIVAAKENSVFLNDLGNIKSCISFYKKLNPKTDGCEAILVGADVFLITKSWFDKQGYTSREVSALLMAEFGSGNFADTTNMNLFVTPVNAGQGTFPGQTHAHQKYWAWFDGRKWHHSKGIKPTMPMYNAWLEMDKQIETIGKQVFRGL